MYHWFKPKMSRNRGNAPILRIKNKTWLKIFDITRLTFREFFRNRCDLRATALSFSTVLSLVPVLSLAFTFFELFGGRDWLTNKIKPYLIDSLAIGVGDKAVETLDHLLVGVSLSPLGTFGIIFLVLAGVSLLSGLENTFNHIWKVTQGRHVLARLRNFLLTIALIPLLILTSLVATSSVHWGGALKAGLPPGLYSVISSWFLPLILEWAGFYLLFQLVPNVRIRYGPAAVGSLVGAGLWEIAKRIYLFYSYVTASSNVLYGAFIALPLFFVWLNITFLILLLALEIAYVLQNFEELKRFQLDPHAEYSLEGIVLNLLVDVANRKCFGAEPLSVNQAAARFDLRTPEYKQLLTRLSRHNLISQPAGDSDDLHLARESSDITIAQVYEALGNIPESGLPEGSVQNILKMQNRQMAELRRISLKDLAGSNAPSLRGIQSGEDSHNAEKV